MTTTVVEARNASPTARAVTDILAPGHLVIAVLLGIGWHSTRGLAGLGWGAIAALFCGGVPLLIIHLGVRRGRLSDQHLHHRRQRIVPMLATLASVITGTALLTAFRAPRELLALLGALFAGLVATLAVTAVWKISFHTAVAAGALTVTAIACGPLTLLIAPVIAAIGWSRVKLRDHTVAQVLAGTLVGAVVAGVVFTTLV